MFTVICMSSLHPFDCKNIYERFIDKRNKRDRFGWNSIVISCHLHCQPILTRQETDVKPMKPAIWALAE